MQAHLQTLLADLWEARVEMAGILPLPLSPLLEVVVVAPTIQQPPGLLLMAAMVVQAAVVVTRLLALLVDQATRLL